MAKNNLPASAYAKPHTMSGKAVSVSDNPGSGPDHSRANTVNMSVGNVTRNEQPGVKTTGIKMRGAGAATKGFMSRGPMA
jgi:hypothetical protein